MPITELMGFIRGHHGQETSSELQRIETLADLRGIQPGPSNTFIENAGNDYFNGTPALTKRTVEIYLQQQNPHLFLFNTGTFTFAALTCDGNKIIHLTPQRRHDHPAYIEIVDHHDGPLNSVMSAARKNTESNPDHLTIDNDNGHAIQSVSVLVQSENEHPCVLTFYFEDYNPATGFGKISERHVLAEKFM